MANQYGDISPRTAAYAAVKMLERAMPSLCMARFGQQQPIPKNKTNTVKFRRYTGFTPNTVPLVEGVTPAPDTIGSQDVTAVLQQFGRRTTITDVIADTHEDPVLNEYAEVMGELAGQTAELVVYNAIRAGTNVMYPTVAITARSGVNAAVSTSMLDRMIRQLKRQNAKPITRMLSGSDKVGTLPIRPSFVVFVHPDVQQGLEALAGYIPAANYGTQATLGDMELGSYKELRFMASTLYGPFLQAGASTAGFLSGGAAVTGNVDVYPFIACGQDAYATVSLAGSTAVSPIAINPKPSDSDPLGQRGHVGFKMYGTSCILNDAWLVRGEAAVAQG
jgi:N4-gp56 family major capsid protein